MIPLARIEAALRAVPSMQVWIVRLICCGREDGIYLAQTWEDADRFRESYCSGVGVGPNNGHNRSGLIVEFPDYPALARAVADVERETWEAAAQEADAYAKDCGCGTYLLNLFRARAAKERQP